MYCLFNNLVLLVSVTGTMLLTSIEVVAGNPSDQFLPEAMEARNIQENTGTELPLDLNFLNDRGEVIRLGDLFTDDKPVIVSLNYSNCPMLCVMQLNGLVNALKEIDLVAGKDFRIVSVSLEPNEPVERLSKTKEKYVLSYGKQVERDGWNFLSGTETVVAALARTMGIHYVYLPKKKEYSHPAVFCICMPDGKISRYHYGIEFPSKTIRLSLVEASEGKIGTAFDKFLLLCFHYDETEGRYAPAARNIMKLGGAITVLGIGLLFWYFHRASKLKVPENTNGSESVNIAVQ